MCANPVCISNHVAHTHDTAQCHCYNAKGKGTKGKEKGHNHRSDGKEKLPDGKGKRIKGKKGKGQSPKGAKGGKGVKGKAALGNRIHDSSAGNTNICFDPSIIPSRFKTSQSQPCFFHIWFPKPDFRICIADIRR